MALHTYTQVLSTTALQLPNHPCKGVQIHNDDASIAIKIGENSTTQNLTVAPGGSTSRIEIGNTNMIWVKSASGTPTCSYATD